MTSEEKAWRRRYNRKRRNDLKEQGICVTCGWRFVVPGQTRCQFCYDRWKAKVDKADPGGKKRIEHRRQQRAERIAAGLCTECGKPATEGMRMCERCRRMRNDSTRKYKIQKKLKRQAEKERAKLIAEGKVKTSGVQNSV